MDEKKIIIQGTRNRYQMKKLVEKKKEPMIRKECKPWNMSSEVYTDAYQWLLIKELYDFATTNALTEKKALSAEASLAKREIEKKDRVISNKIFVKIAFWNQILLIFLELLQNYINQT